MLPGTLVGLGASAVTLAGSVRHDRTLMWRGMTVGYSALGLTWLNRVLNPQLRAARQRATAAEAMWIDVRRQMNRWESTARDWDASRSGPSLLSWQTEDARLAQLAARCADDER
jgi:hypothetical protein